MNVVSCYRAAKIAGVSKQRISSMKKANADSKGKYPFFAFDSKEGYFGVDIDHREWQSFIDRRKSTGLLQSPGANGQSENTLSQSTESRADQLTIMQDLLIAVDGAISEILKPSQKKRETVRNEIVRRHTEMVGDRHDKD